jgi:Ni,Fe-hydrogenase maturation factor
MRRAVVVGLGEVTRGDGGAGPYVIEALAQEPSCVRTINVELVDLGPRILDLDVHLYRKDYAILVQTLARGYPGGHVSQLTYHCFHSFAGSAACGGMRNCREPDRLRSEFPGTEMRPVLERLHLAEYLGVIPPEITFIIIEPQLVDQGLGISGEVRPAIRKAVRLVKKNLEQRGFLPVSPVVSLLRYRLDLLQVTI